MLPAYDAFMQRFPDVQTLAKASENEVLELWAGLGYYSRARNLHRCARQIVKQHGGKFPEDAKQVLALPGIGPYTSAAVRSIAMGISDAVVDGNVVRVLSRLFFTAKANSDSAAKKERQSNQDSEFDSTSATGTNHARAAEIMARKIIQDSPLKPSIHNQAIMELGALICTPGLPACLLCPLQTDCHVFRKGGAALAAEIPPLKKAIKQDLELQIYWTRSRKDVWVIKNSDRPIFRNDWFLPCRILGTDGLIYSDFDEERIFRSTKKSEKTAKAKLPAPNVKAGFPFPLAEPSGKPFRHSIMNYRIQGQLYSLDLSEKQMGSLMRNDTQGNNPRGKPGAGQNKKKEAGVPLSLASGASSDKAVVAEADPTYANSRRINKTAGKKENARSLAARNDSGGSDRREIKSIRWHELQSYCPSSIIKKAIPGIS